ncbi:hypothetical protein B0H14DRAFT_2723614 [Mycena olivaceomarginata]|nr:hypothetical protein B0H14DRAFT_2723614 [Mycena olivaceomarginata]
MPAAPVPSTLRLHTLRVAGDCKILVPLGAWLVPQGALAALHTLVLDVTPYGRLRCAGRAPCHRARRHAVPARVDFAARSTSMPLDPVEAGSGPFRLASFPRLRALNLRDGYGATIDASLAWLAGFLLPSTASSFCSSSRDTYSALEELSFDHSMHPHLHLRTVAFTGSQKLVAMDCGRTHDSGADELLAHFSRTVRERLPGLVRRGVLVVGR